MVREPPNFFSIADQAALDRQTSDPLPMSNLASGAALIGPSRKIELAHLLTIMGLGSLAWLPIVALLTLK
jgi:hypothetical protein